MSYKSKFNKTKCAKCMYRSKFSTRDGSSSSVCCNYSGVTGHTCLHNNGRSLIDSRGDDYDKCRLYIKGDLQLERQSIRF